MDWKATFEEILAERRQELGERPSADDLIALRAGELADDERQRLLEYASVDPEVGRELLGVLRFPERPVDEGSDDEGSDDEGLGERWRALRERLIEEDGAQSSNVPANVLPMSVNGPSAKDRPARAQTAGVGRRWLPLAAMFVLGAGAMLFFDQGRGPRVNLEIVELLPVGDDSASRSVSEGVMVGEGTGGLVLTLAVPDLSASEGGSFSLEWTRGDGSTTTLEGLTPGLGGVFVLEVPREEWSDGLHELRLMDADGKPVARFRLEVELRQ